MFNFIKAHHLILVLFLSVLGGGYASAGNKIVVIPMAGDSAQKSQWAVVSANGTITSQSGGITINTSRVASNSFYYLNFGSSVANSGVSATLSYGNNGSFGLIQTFRCETDGICALGQGKNVVYVGTADKDGVSANRSFYVVVTP